MDKSLLWLGLPAVVMMSGGALAAVWRPGSTLISLVQHIAAGVILAAVTIEVFPEMRSGAAAPPTLIASFCVGVVFMYVVKIFGERLESRAGPESATRTLNYGFLVAVFLDAALDGVTIGAGFAAGTKVGSALALGLSIEMLFLSMSLISDSLNGWKLFWLTAALSVILFGMALIGYFALAALPPAAVSIALAFCSAALLYLVTEELLIEAHAHSQPEHPYSMLVLYAAFAGFWALSYL